jgi:putative PIN family toxin of toxin-antitoxin system
MRFVLDTNVIVAALRSTRGASAAVLRGVREGRGILLLSTPLLLEYEAVCKEAVHLEAAGLSAEEVDMVLNVLVARAERVETSYRWRPQLRDAGDELVLEAAVNGRADALATFNTRDFAAAAPRFGPDLIGPKELLRRMA